MQASPLSEKHVVELNQAAERALAQWLTEPLTDPLEIIRALDRVLLFLKQNGDPSAQARQVASLAFAFGAQLVRANVGTWQSVSEDGSVNPAVVLPRARACLVVDLVTAMVTGTSNVGLVELFRGLSEGAEVHAPGIAAISQTIGSDAVLRLERDVFSRLTHVKKALKMWGSPEELEAVAEHFTHVLLMARTPGWTLEQTHALWMTHGAPFAADADEHAAMRAKLWAEHLETSRGQVAIGYLTIWTALDRDPEREALLATWIESLLDEPRLAGTPDRLNAVLFALIGFVARDPQAYVNHLASERTRIGGHALRPFHVVAPAGPSEVHLPYTRNFTSWESVSSGITRVVEALERPARS